MNRSAVIATVVATTGVLVAGSVAGVAVINAASSSESSTSGISLVADGTTEQPIVLGASALAPATDATLDLPALPSVPPVGSGAGTSSVTPATGPSEGDDRSSGAAVDDTTGSDDSASTVTSRRAARTVVAETGGSVVRVTSASRGGYQAWAVTVKRPDGSVVTGYVDRASGVVFDWVVNEQAPTRPANSGNSESDDDANEDSDDSVDSEDHAEEDDSDDDSDGSDDSGNDSSDDHDDESEYDGDDD